MQYKRLGSAGLKVSQLSFGSWVTFSNQMEIKAVQDSLSVAREYGVNFFDNAEVYAGGKSEELMGQAFKNLAWNRLDYIISTKFFWGIHEGVNSRNTLNRKYLMNAIEGSLKRLQMDYVDIVYCHRPDSQTPIEETVYAMNDMIRQGKALYWGTSEWSAAEISLAWSIAEKHHLHKPIVEQPQYNLIHKDRVELEYKRLYSDIGLGLTTWSPLASGILTGKYLNEIPAGSRASMKSLSFLIPEIENSENKARVIKLIAKAKEMGCTPSQLAIAWCAYNPNVSTVITGASRIEQIKENMDALKVLEKMTPTDYQSITDLFK